MLLAAECYWLFIFLGNQVGNTGAGIDVGFALVVTGVDSARGFEYLRGFFARDEGDARFVVIGGAPLDGRRFMFWNFVSSSKERLLQAAEDWDAQRFDPVPGETEFIPLPDP